MSDWERALAFGGAFLALAFLYIISSTMERIEKLLRDIANRRD